MHSWPNNSQSPALAGNVDWHWQDRNSSICCNLLFRCERSNEHSLIEQLGICSQVQTCDCCIGWNSLLGTFKRFRHLASETWGFQPRVGIVIPAFRPLLHNLFTQLCLILQLFLLKGSSCLSLFSLIIYSRTPWFFLSERRNFVSSFLCLNGLLLTCLMSEKSVKQLPQLNVTCWGLDKPFPALPEGTRNSINEVTFFHYKVYDLKNLCVDK